MYIFVDEDPNRAALAYSRMNDYEQKNTIWCSSIKEAKETVWDYRKKVTKIMLEHDFNGTYVDVRREDSGMEFIRFIENKFKKDPVEFKDLEKTDFVIHTWNTYAGNLMTNRLLNLGLNAEYIPFGM